MPDDPKATGNDQPPDEPKDGKPETGASGQPSGDGGKQTDDFKSEASKKAVLADLAKEREARKALEAKFAKLGEAFGGDNSEGGKADIDQLTERISKHEQELAEERQARLRAEVANAKKLTSDQAAFLAGSTREEIEESADRLLAAFPAEEGKSGQQGSFDTGRGKSYAKAQLDRSDLARMTPAQIESARKEGRLDRLMGKPA